VTPAASPAAGDPLAYQPYRAPADQIYALGRTDFRPGIDPLPPAQEAWAMTRDLFGRPVHGEPAGAMVKVIEPVPRDPEPNEVIVQNLFAGSTHNVLHALLADPVSPFEWHRLPYHVLGSGAVCRVVACGVSVCARELSGRGNAQRNSGILIQTRACIAVTLSDRSADRTVLCHRLFQLFRQCCCKIRAVPH